MQGEGSLVNACLVALSGAGCTVFRNDTGAYKTPEGRLIRYGLCKGSADIIGWTGEGVFLAVECKTARGRTTPEQDRFLAAVSASGGRSGVALSPAQAVAIALGVSAG